MGEMNNDYIIEYDTGLSGSDFDGDDMNSIYNLCDYPRLWRSNNWLKMHGYPMRRKLR